MQSKTLHNDKLINNRSRSTRFFVLTDGNDETREFEEESDDSRATDVLSEVTGRERNKEEIFDTVRPYKSEGKYDIQNRRRPGGYKIKEQELCQRWKVSRK